MKIQMFQSIAESLVTKSPQQQCGGDSIVGMILPFALIFGIFYFLVIRPQKNQQKKHQQMIDSMKKGDEIITNGGLYGTVDRVLDDRIKVEVAPKMVITLKKNAVASVVDPDAVPAAEKDSE